MNKVWGAAIAFAFLSISTASAQTSAFASGAVEQLITAIHNTSAAQIGNIMKNGGSIRTALSGLGGRIGYGGAAQIGGLAIVAALNHFYDTVKDQANPTGTALDTYFAPVNRFDLCHAYKNPSDNFFAWSAQNAGPTNFTSMAQAMQDCVSQGAPEREALLQQYFNYFPNGVQRYEWHPQYDSPTYAQTQMDYYAYPNPVDTLPDFVIGNPDAGEGAKAALEGALRDSLASNPDALPAGVSVSPLPNANQAAGDAVNPNLDTDHDGYTDAAELSAGTNPNSALSHPDTPPTGPVDPVPPDPTATPGGCGDFSFIRLTTEPGAFMHDLVFPCQDLANFMQPLIESAKTKFPFSLTSNLSNMVNYSGGEDMGAVLPSHLGPFALDWAWIAPLITTVGLLFKAFTTWLMIDFILSKFSGQVVLK